MSEWAVNLEFVEDGSSKFWRARTEGAVLYVNYGRIGTGGQVQMKDLGSPAAVAKELDKLIREKRKKGYEDAGSTGAADADEEEEEEEAPRPKKPAAPAAAAAPPAPVVRIGVPRNATAELVLQVGARQVLTRATIDGVTVSVSSTETHADPDAASAAFDRLCAALIAEGHGLKEG